jgi:hypothetical protein
MEKIIIEIRDNPQGIDLNKIIKEIKAKFLDLGLFVTITIKK